MTYSDEYAIVDATKGSTSEGKVLVLLDNDATAQEIANELRQRGGSVVVTTFRHRRQPAINGPGDDVTNPAGPSELANAVT